MTTITDPKMLNIDDQFTINVESSTQVYKCLVVSKDSANLKFKFKHQFKHQPKINVDEWNKKSFEKCDATDYSIDEMTEYINNGKWVITIIGVRLPEDLFTL